MSIKNISPIDGRYSEPTKELSRYVSEEALIRNRVYVECMYFIALVELINPTTRYPHMDIRLLKENKTAIEHISTHMTDEDFESIKQVEGIINHDVKAVEYFVKGKLKDMGFDCYMEWVHLGLTSEDVNNLAYALMVKNSLQDILVSELHELIKTLAHLTEKYSHIPMLTRTHGQPASPSTVGKEFAVYLNRLYDELQVLKDIEIEGKLNGAIGNYNALCVAFPFQDINWLDFSLDFIISDLSLAPNLVTTQVESRDSFARVFDSLSRINNIVLDLDVDVWYYISLGYFKLEKKDTEVGSSTMPHKINPIDFENSEGNLGVANTMLHFLKDKLTKSRMQRDLSDSTVLRNIGTAFSHSLLGYKSTIRGLNKLSSNIPQIVDDLEKHPEVLSEALQTILRVEGIEKPYELLKTLTRGNSITSEAIEQWIASLDVRDSVKTRLRSVTVHNYIGYSTPIINYVLDKVKNIVNYE